MKSAETKLRDTVKDLFSQNRIDIALGYRQGSLPLTMRPCFIRDGSDADTLIWNSLCSNNLAVYLPRLFEKPARIKEDFTLPKVGIVVKGCDARSVIGLIKEHQVPRDNIVIIGMPCPGMVDPTKITAAVNGKEIKDYKESGNEKITVTTDSDSKDINRNEFLSQECIECVYPVHTEADILIEGDARDSVDGLYERVKEFEAKSPEERWQYFVDEISKCIRCNACRQACPNCYCKICFADQTKPAWVSSGNTLSDISIYHIGRLFHQAGRCVECDACVKACPMGIDLRLFTQKFAMDTKELFGSIAGVTDDALPPLCTFKEEDDESFITDPEEN